MRTRDIRAEDMNPETYKRNPFDMLQQDDQQAEEAGLRPEQVEQEAFNSLATAKKPAKSLLFAGNDEPEEPPPPQPKVLPQARQTPSLSNEWVRQDLPSLAVPYQTDDFFVRPLTMPILSKIFAAHKAKSFTFLVDALSHCIHGIDIRDMTPGDFNFFMYWVRDNSYVRSPLRISWLSRYNNQNEMKIRVSNLEITELEMTREQYAEHQEKGLCFPTVRDMELLKSPDLKDEDQWLLDYAQYCVIPPTTSLRDYTQTKINALNALVAEHGLEETIMMIDEFAESIAHGVHESFAVKDPKFEPLAAADYFEKMGRSLLAALENYTDDTRSEVEAELLSVMQRATALLNEAKTLRERVAAGERVEAEEEVVVLNISATDFFPSLR